MGWQEQLPWATRPLGELPGTLHEHLKVLGYAAKDLPRTLREDATIEMAAGMTFFLLFSLFPALVFLVTLLPYLPLDAPIEDLFVVAEPLLPAEVHDLLYGHVTDLVSRPRKGLLTLSAAIALYSASRALVSLSRSLNRSYRVPKIKSELLRRVRSIVLTIVALAGIVAAVVLLSLGDQIVGAIVEKGWLPISSGVLIVVFRWPVLLLLGAFLVQQLYHLLPDVRPRWRAVSTGSLLAVLGWVTATWAFTEFAAKLVRFNVTYGSLGSFAVVMAWMFLGSFALMAGGSINALVDRGLPPLKRDGSPRVPRPLPQPVRLHDESADPEVTG
jgi:membrane protein